MSDPRDEARAAGYRFGYRWAGPIMFALGLGAVLFGLAALTGGLR